MSNRTTSSSQSSVGSYFAPFETCPPIYFKAHIKKPVAVIAPRTAQDWNTVRNCEIESSSIKKISSKASSKSSESKQQTPLQKVSRNIVGRERESKERVTKERHIKEKHIKEQETKKEKPKASRWKELPVVLKTQDFSSLKYSRLDKPPDRCLPGIGIQVEQATETKSWHKLGKSPKQHVPVKRKREKPIHEIRGSGAISDDSDRIPLYTILATRPESKWDSLRAYNFNVHPLRREVGGGGRRVRFEEPPVELETLVSPTEESVISKPTQSQLPSTGFQPIFEVVSPVTDVECPKLFYQNSYLLDGITYTMTNKHRGKLVLNYEKFKKSLTSTKPSDKDIIYGDARIVYRSARGWEHQGLDWLAELERQNDQLKSPPKQKSMSPGGKVFGKHNDNADSSCK